MRGPFDETIEGQQDRRARTSAAKKDRAREPLPGGKPLVRLLQLLGTAGLTEEASAVVHDAVPDDRLDEFVQRAAPMVPAPTGALLGEEAYETGAAPAAEAGEDEEAGSPEASASTEDIARTYMETGEHLTGVPSGTGPQWRSLGPWTIPNGQTYGASRVNVSGRISAVAVDPSNPAHVLAGAANGGVWESRDRGASWAPRTDYAATLTVGALAFDPRSPATVYCGTGEGNWWSWLGAGVLRSTDGGTTWATLCTTPFVGLGFYDLIVDPADGRHLLAATTGGLFVSTDGGVTWTQRRTARTWSLAIAPAGGASAEILAASSDGIFRSTNGGTTWAAVTLPGTPGAFDRLAVAIARSNPQVAYAWGARGTTAYLWRRSGTTWTSVAAPPGVSTNQAWYDWFLAAAPDRDTQVYCGAIEVHRGDLTSGTWSWRNITNKGSTGQSIHPDQHAIAFEPGQPATIYVGNDGGMYRSPDRGETWQQLNNGLVITEFEYIAQDYGSARFLIGGTQDNGTERWTGSAVWEHVADGDGGDCGVNRTNPRIAFHTYYGMSPERSSNAAAWASWTWIGPPVAQTDSALFYPPFECSATLGDTIAIGGNKLWISRNNGTAWISRAIADGLASAIYIPNANNVYVGTTTGRIYRTQWNGTDWTALTALTTPRAGATISDLYVDPANLSRLWVTHRTIGGGRVFRSLNAGSSWEDRSAGGLPALPMNAVEVDPGNVNRVWVAADLGVYQTFDGGATWTDFSNALPNAYVGDLVFQPHARVLRAGTRNRGVWEIPVDGWMTQPQCGRQFAGSLAGGQSGRWFTFNWPATWHVVWTIMPTAGRAGIPQVSWTVEVERASSEYVTYWLNVRNLTPDPVTFDGRFCILSRY